MKVIRKFKSNFDSFDEVLLFIEIFFLITILPLLIKRLTVSRLMKTLTPRTVKYDNKNNYEELKGKIVKYTDYILSRNFWVYRSTCLKRSLVLYHFLRKSGINTQICFGVRYNEDLTYINRKKRIEGHAWLLYNGDIFLEMSSEMAKTYTVTYCFPERNG
ncbi:MAG: lasso peptide biosynthesis B2 protein [Nitrospirota bacterium]